MDGWVPDSIRYVPGRSELQVRGVVAPPATSVPKDCTRGPWAGGVKAWPLGTGATVAHVALPCCSWVGLGVWVADVPSPPPNWPTIVRDVGTLLFPNCSLFVRLMVRLCPVGTVITTGDQPDPAAGFEATQVAGEAAPVQA